MKNNKVGKGVSKMLMAVTVMFIATLVLASGAAASQYKVLHQFTWASTPVGNLVIDAAGNLYGVAKEGASTACVIPGPYGGNGCGLVFKLTPNSDGTWKETTIHAFTGGQDGGLPKAGLIFDGAGNLYGTTAYYGSYAGVAFELTPGANGTWTEKPLHEFLLDDGTVPMAPLIFDASGNLYGTTFVGGSEAVNSDGVVFELMHNEDGTWTEKALFTFSYAGSSGDGPMAGLILDAAGNLYGTTYWGGSGCFIGCGVVFKVTPNLDGSWTESVVHEFTNGEDGGFPAADLIFDGAGNLYGTTSSGGTYGNGVVFRLTSKSDGTWTESILHAFNGADGASPSGGLIFDTAGNLYGATGAGGRSGYGVVFKLAPSSGGTWRESVLHSFLGYGQAPAGGVVMDKAGNLYGTASAGNNNHGLVFEITP